MPTALATRSAPVIDTYTDAFLFGFVRGAMLTRGVAMVGSFVALAFLPARSSATGAANEPEVSSTTLASTVGVAL